MIGTDIEERRSDTGVAPFFASAAWDSRAGGGFKG